MLWYVMLYYVKLCYVMTHIRCHVRHRETVKIVEKERYEDIVKSEMYACVLNAWRKKIKKQKTHIQKEIQRAKKASKKKNRN